MQLVVQRVGKDIVVHPQAFAGKATEFDARQDPVGHVQMLTAPPSHSLCTPGTRTIELPVVRQNFSRSAGGHALVQIVETVARCGGQGLPAGSAANRPTRERRGKLIKKNCPIRHDTPLYVARYGLDYKFLPCALLGFRRHQPRWIALLVGVTVAAGFRS